MVMEKLTLEDYAYLRKQDQWLLGTACEALFGNKLPERYGDAPQSKEGIELCRLAAISRRATKLKIQKNREGRRTWYRVWPAEFLEWATGKGYAIPPELGSVLEGISPLRENEIARIGCQAVARYVWSEKKNLKVREVARIVREPSGAGRYQVDTIMRWIREFNPNPKPGRRSPT